MEHRRIHYHYSYLALSTYLHVYIYAQNLAKLLCNPSESLVRFYIILVSSEITNCI